MKTIRETLMDVLTQNGYDTISACEIAELYMAELRQKPAGEYCYYVSFPDKTLKISIIVA